MRMAVPFLLPAACLITAFSFPARSHDLLLPRDGGIFNALRTLQLTAATRHDPGRGTNWPCNLGIIVFSLVSLLTSRSRTREETGGEERGCDDDYDNGGDQWLAY